MTDDDQLYEPLFKQAVEMQYKFHDFTAGSNQAEVHVLQNEIHQLIGDIRSRRNINDIEHRIDGIQHQLAMGQHAPQPYMAYNHTDYLHNNYQHMREQLQGYHPKQQ